MFADKSGKEIRIHPRDFHLLEEAFTDRSLNTLDSKLNSLLHLRDVPIISDFNISRGKIMLLDWDKIKTNGFILRWYVFQEGGGI